MFVRQIYDDDLAQAAYLIGCQATGEAIVVDPERDVDRYLRVAQENNLRLVAAAETHIHADFLSGARELAERAGVRVYVSGEGGPDWRYGWLDEKDGGGAYDAVVLANGDAFTVGAIRFQALHTPGHTPEHLCYLVYDAGADDPMALLSGDFVFVGDLGRPDLLETAAGQVGSKADSARDLFESTKILRGLPDYAQVWPAHGSGSACGKALGAVPQSTIGYEARHNASLLAATDEAGFVRTILDGQPDPPLYFARMKRDNKNGPPILGELPAPTEEDPKRLLSLDPERTVVIDTRPWPAFRDGHAPGAIWAPLGVMFAMVAGSYAEPDQDIYLVCAPEQEDRATRVLVRIGLDRVIGFVRPERLGEVAGDIETTPETGADAVQGGDAFVLDVRNPGEHAEAHVPGGVNIAYTRLKDRLSEVPKDRPILCHCRSGVRSAAATSFLRREGYDATNLEGGFLAWRRAGGPVESGRAVSA